MHKTITLSDNLPCKVRVLGLYELDGKASEPLGPYRYSILTATGQILEDEYRLDTLTSVPQPPKTLPDDKSSYEWLQQQEYDTYLAAIAHESKRLESYEIYLNEVSQYILLNCLESSDQSRVITPDDWRKVQSVALVPQLTEEVIADTLSGIFQG